DIGGRALEQADTTAQLGRTVAVEGVVEAEARLQQAVAVDGRAVVVTEGGVGGGVVGRTILDVRLDIAQAEGQRQVVVDVPGVLDEDAEVLHAPDGGHVVEVAAGRVEVLEEARNASLEVVDAVEGVDTVGAATEQVVDVIVLEVETELDGVRVEEQVAGEERVPGLGLEDVDVGVLFGTEVQDVVADADGHFRSVGG